MFPGTEDGDLFGQHLDNGRGGDTAALGSSDNLPAGRVRLYSQQAKVSFTTILSDHLLRTPGRCITDEIITHGGKKLQQITGNCRQVLAKGTITAQELASVNEPHHSPRLLPLYKLLGRN